MPNMRDGDRDRDRDRGTEKGVFFTSLVESGLGSKSDVKPDIPHSLDPQETQRAEHEGRGQGQGREGAAETPRGGGGLGSARQSRLHLRHGQSAAAPFLSAPLAT